MKAGWLSHCCDLIPANTIATDANTAYSCHINMATATFYSYGYLLLVQGSGLPVLPEQQLFLLLPTTAVIVAVAATLTTTRTLASSTGSFCQGMEDGFLQLQLWVATATYDGRVKVDLLMLQPQELQSFSYNFN